MRTTVLARLTDARAVQVVAGALTGIVQVMATNPMEIVKLRMQSAEPVSTTTATTHSTSESSLGPPLRFSAMLVPLRHF